jgi:hypothetical protein
VPGSYVWGDVDLAEELAEQLEVADGGEIGEG